MRNILAVALLAAIAPLGIAHAATPKTTPSKATSSKPKPTTMAMKGHKMPMKAHKTSTKKSTAHKMTTTSTKKTTPARDAKTGRFLKTTTVAKTSKK